MDTTNVVAILLFVLPGVLAEKISYRMDFPSSEKRSDYRELINGIMLSFPILAAVGLVFSLIHKIKTLKGFINALDRLTFLSTFSISIFIVSILLGIAKGLTKDFRIKIINKMRRKINKINIDDKSCWRKIFLEDIYTEKDKNRTRYPKYLIVEKEGEIKQEGFALSYSLPNENLEVAVEMPENIEYYPNFKDYLTDEKIYINLEKGIIIKSYDTRKFNEYLQQFIPPPTERTKALSSPVRGRWWNRLPRWVSRMSLISRWRRSR